MGKKYIIDVEVLTLMNNTMNSLLGIIDSYKSITVSGVNFHNQLQKTIVKDIQDVQVFRQKINTLQVYIEPIKEKPIEPAKQENGKPVDPKVVEIPKK